MWLLDVIPQWSAATLTMLLEIGLLYWADGITLLAESLLWLAEVS